MPRAAKRRRRERRGHECRRETSNARGYDYRWSAARRRFLLRPENALCRLCQAAGRMTESTIVDHIRPHRGDKALFWDVRNWQPLCKRCHDQKTAREDGGFGNARRSGGSVAALLPGWAH